MASSDAISAEHTVSAIPTRVQCTVPLESKGSSVNEGRKGVFTMNDIKEGDLIFSIKNPLLRVVSFTLKSLSPALGRIN